jgi:GTP-binding protein Era
MHRSGFVSIVGNPNVGKSTIMNALVGEKLSIITSKSQTTRHRIMGIVNGEDFQIVYSDTPGVLKPSSKLHESMLKFSKSSLEDADVILYVSDVFETIDKNADFVEQVKKTKVPVILVINKIDLADQEKLENLVETWRGILPDAFILPTSATENFNISNLFDKIYELLPEGPPYFPKDQLTDKSERFFVSEIIREKILLNYKKEVPYSTEVEVEEFKEDDDIIRIRAVIYVERDTQKGIIIGHKGEALKKTGIMARKDIEEFFEKKVFLGLFVKVDKDWKNKQQSLRKFGYE